MNKVLDICRFIVNYSNKNSYGVSNLKLQKLLYFVQAKFLLETGEPCFDEKIEAWAYGPVIPEAYHEFKEYGGMNIPTIHKYKTFKSFFEEPEIVEFKENIITSANREKIISVLKFFENYTAGNLVDITHNQDPWKNAYKSNCKIIENDYIKRYFNVHR
ncbi:MAG: Panacea domain-containing protein [Fusobacteriaceae bacterium]